MGFEPHAVFTTQSIPLPRISRNSLKANNILNYSAILILKTLLWHLMSVDAYDVDI